MRKQFFNRLLVALALADTAFLIFLSSDNFRKNFGLATDLHLVNQRNHMLKKFSRILTRPLISFGKRLLLSYLPN